ncbi:peptidylprolyl isomerase [Piscinibacter sakaiensis]|uniref:peptidylprolyl isomerase n=1 Tax=Piscinibacter sakaiensis TaxID=1547922 RepID=UPI003AAE71D9
MNELTQARGDAGLHKTAAPRMLGSLLACVLAAAAAPDVTAQLKTPERASAQRPAAAAAPAPAPASARRGDYILAVVNQELVTAGELAIRLERVREAARAAGNRLPPGDELRKEILQQLIDERVLITAARETGQRVDEAELDRAVNNVAVQNQLSPLELRQRLQREGIDYGRFRNNLRDQILVERTREREVQSRIRITDAEVDAELARQHAASGGVQYNIAQILVAVPERASDAQVMERRIRAEGALARVRAGESFEAVARQMSDGANAAEGGELGLRPADRLPDIFVARVKTLKTGEIAPELLRSGAGFHILKLKDRREPDAFTVTQTHARHILLRPSAQLSEEAAMRRLAEFKRQIQAGRASFEALARDNSEDNSAVAGGDLGWTSPGSLVPEFEQTMDALPVGGISDPIVSRFGVHLIQVIDRREVELDTRQRREQARNVLRERKYEAAYEDWLKELRARAYIEMREPPP